MGEVLRHFRNFVGAVWFQMVTIHTSGFVQPVKNSVDFAVVKQGVQRVHTGLESAADFRGHDGTRKVIHAPGTVEHKRNPAGDGGGVLGRKMNTRHRKNLLLFVALCPGGAGPGLLCAVQPWQSVRACSDRAGERGNFQDAGGTEQLDIRKRNEDAGARFKVEVPPG